jgi:signal transduction histidine kinase
MPAPKKTRTVPPAAKAAAKPRAKITAARRVPRTASRKSPATDVAKLRLELEEKLLQLTESNRRLQRKIFDLYTVFEISRNFNSVLKYQSLLDTFIFTCLGQVGALKGAIFLKREGASEFITVVKTKGSGDFPSVDQGFDLKSKLVNYLTKLNRPVLVSELSSEAASADEKKVLAYFSDGIIVPLIYQTRLIGVFAMAEKISGREFLMDDIEFLSILGNQIAVAIENARLYEGEKAATQQLREAQQQLLQTERQAALGDMSAKIAHEVNNPLGIIKNYLLLIKRASAEAPDLSKYTGIVEQEIDRIAGIVRQLLDFHRPQPVVQARINLMTVVEDVLTLMERPLGSSNIELVRNISPDLPDIFGSADRLKQVFLNLVINARDAMPDGGRLTVTAGESDSNIFVRLCDTGPGIPTEIIPRIFEPFFTTKEPGQGTGLGLSVCYSIIKAHNGSITFRNNEPGGCFTVTLPAAVKRNPS